MDLPSWASLSSQRCERDLFLAWRRSAARFELLVTVSFGTFLWFWLKEQCRPYRTSFPLDIGFFVWWAGVVVVPYYLWRYQRWRGVAKVGVILSAYAAAYLFSLVVHYSLVWIDE